MKNKGLIIFVIVLLIICILLLSGILFFSLSGKKINGVGRLFNTYRISNTRIYDKTYDDPFTSISIDTAAANIEIKKGNENKVVIYGEEDKLSISDDTNLSIRYDSEPCHFFCLNVTSSKIEVYLDETFKGDINIDNDYGDIEIDDFIYSKVKVDSSFGDTEISSAQSVDLSSSCGDIKVGEVGYALINNNYGDIKISKITEKANIEADCGDIKINEVDLKENSSIENNLGNIKIDRTNDIMIESKVSLGDNKVNNSNNKSDIILKITNDCGDIKVN